MLNLSILLYGFRNSETRQLVHKTRNLVDKTRCLLDKTRGLVHKTRGLVDKTRCLADTGRHLVGKTMHLVVGKCRFYSLGTNILLTCVLHWFRISRIFLSTFPDFTIPLFLSDNPNSWSRSTNQSRAERRLFWICIYRNINVYIYIYTICEKTSNFMFGECVQSEVFLSSGMKHVLFQ